MRHDARVSEARRELAALLELAPDAMLAADPRGIVTAANARAEALFARGPLTGLVAEAILAAAPVPVEVTRRDHPEVTVLAVRPTHQAAIAQELRTSQDRLQAVLDNSQAVIYLKDVDGRFVVVNRGFEELFEVRAADVIGRSDDDIIGVAAAELVRQNDREVMASGAPVSVEEVAPTPDGVRTFLSLKFPLVDERGRSTGVGGVSTDITERIRAQEEQARLRTQLDRSQRLESVGQLAGGIAHDFNNLLAVIMNFAGFVQSAIPAGTPVADDVEQILQAARRAAELTRRLLVFSRRQPGRAEVLDLNASVTEIERILSRTLGEHIELRTRLEPGLWRVQADRGQLEQVLMNLAVNARDAMADGGALTIATHNVMLDAEFARARGDERLVGPFVELTVSDCGTGMDAETAERAFEPFFTTKPVGVGSGLGLATVYGIVQQAGGAIQLYSQPESGTTVRVHLPATGAPAAPGPVDAATLPPAGQGERVLLVEDEPAVRAAARRILTDAGYAVLEAADGTQALSVDQAQQAIDLLVTDVVMPGMSGPELADHLHTRRPGLPVVYMSGYADDVLLRRGTVAADDAFVDKPFTAARLLAAVRERLHAPD